MFCGMTAPAPPPITAPFDVVMVLVALPSPKALVVPAPAMSTQLPLFIVAGKGLENVELLELMTIALSPWLGAILPKVKHAELFSLPSRMMTPWPLPPWLRRSVPARVVLLVVFVRSLVKRYVPKITSTFVPLAALSEPFQVTVKA